MDPLLHFREDGKSFIRITHRVRYNSKDFQMQSKVPNANCEKCAKGALFTSFSIYCIFIKRYF